MANTTQKEDLIEITSGQTVAQFLNQINYNFSYLKGNKHITISENPPDDQTKGEDGDIWIVYEK